MLSYTAPKATVRQLLLKHHSPPAASGNLQVQKVLHRLKIAAPLHWVIMCTGAVMSSADT